MPDAEVDKKQDETGVAKTNQEDQVVSKGEESSGSGSKTRTVSFNRDVHVKRIAPNRTPLAASAADAVRRQPLARLSRQELAQEAAKVLAQASAVHCSSTSPPDKFFSLPTRKKHKPESSSQSSPVRRRSEELGVTTDFTPKTSRTSLTRSTSDVTAKKYKKPPNNTLLNLFKRSDKEPQKDNVTLKRSKSDVSDLESSNVRQVRKRTGSESEEYLNSVVGKKSQLSPIIEINQTEDYFKQKGPKVVDIRGNSNFERIVLELPEGQQNPTADAKPATRIEYKVNPIEKPPRTKEPKPPARPKRARTITTKDDHVRPVKTTVRQFNTLPTNRASSRLLVDEIDTSKTFKKNNIKQTIKALEETLQETKQPEMIHSSQLPPEKPPLTKGHTVDTMVRILNQDRFSPPPKTSLVAPPSAAAHNNNQPFSYTKPISVSPDPNLYARSPSPDRAPSPINKMNPDLGKGIIYAQVVCGENGKRSTKQTIHTSVSPDRHRVSHHSDEDEGLGGEENRLQGTYRNEHRDFSYNSYKNDDYSYRHNGNFDVTDSPITPRFKEYRTRRFIDDEITYENQQAVNGGYKEKHFNSFEETDYRGRGDGMDAIKREHAIEPMGTKYDNKIAELSYRRELLESRFNARKKRDTISPGNQNTHFNEKEYDNDRTKNENDFISRYNEKDHRLMSNYDEKTTKDTTRQHDSMLSKLEFRSKSKRTPSPMQDAEIDRREFIDRRLAEEPLETKYFSKDQSRYFPPEPEYEPPSLDSSRATYSPQNRKYKSNSSRTYLSSQDGLHTTTRYNAKHKEKFNASKDHYASNPEIYQKEIGEFSERRSQYDPLRPETFHNSLQRQKVNNSDRHYRNHENYLGQSSSKSFHDLVSDYREESSGLLTSRSRYDNDRERDNKFADSGIENDYRKDSNGEINFRVVSLPSRETPTKSFKSDLKNESEDEGFASSLLIASERQHTEDNCTPKRSQYRNMDFTSNRREEFVHREKSIDDGSFYDPRIDKFEERTHHVNTRPPKATKKMTGLEKVKQLFSRDSSKKSKKDKEKYKDSPKSSIKQVDDNLMVKEEDLRRRYTEYRGSSEDLDTIGQLRKSRITRSSDLEIDSRLKYTDEENSILGYDYSQRRRLATPSPSPSPPRNVQKSVFNGRKVTSSSGWFKSLDRLSKPKTKSYKEEKDSIVTTEEESTLRSKRKSPSTKLPTKNLRFFGDTDLESNDSVSKRNSVLKKRSNVSHLRSGKSLSNSVNALDRAGYNENKYKSSSFTNLQSTDSRQNLLLNSYNKERYNSSKRDLHNISEIHSNSETESQFEENQKHIGKVSRKDTNTLKGERKPPMSPLREKKRSRSQSGARTTKNAVKSSYHGSRGDLNESSHTDSKMRVTSSDIQGSKQELHGSRNELRSRRRRVPTNPTSPGDSSTEGDSSHQSQRSIVYLHAATVGDIPSSRMSRGRSRDDVSSINSSLQPHTKTVSRSFSVLAPWKPRFYREGYDINYSQSGHESTMKRYEKPTNRSQPTKKESGFNFGKTKSASTRNLSVKNDRSSEEKITGKSNTSSLSRQMRNNEDKKLISSNGTLLRKNNRMRQENISSKENLNSYQLGNMSRNRNDFYDKNYKKSMSTEILSVDSPSKGVKRSSVEREKLSRSISMPKDPNKSAGWFKITKKSKKIENKAY